MNFLGYIRNFASQLALYTLFELCYGGRLGSVIVKADSHCAAMRHRCIRGGSNPASNIKKVLMYVLMDNETDFFNIQIY